MKIEKPDILKLFGIACRTEDFSFKRRTCPLFARRLATLVLFKGLMLRTAEALGLASAQRWYVSGLSNSLTEC